MDLPHTLPSLLGSAWLLPLASFTLIVFFGPRMGKHGKGAGYLATLAIIGACVLSFIALFGWIGVHGTGASELPEIEEQHAAAEHAAPAGHDAHGAGAGAAAGDAHGSHATKPKAYYSGDWYIPFQFGSLKMSIGYYIDALTVGIFCMVTLIASCIHVYSIGYMHDELHEVVDHEVKMSDGHHLHRPGRFSRFFQYMSLFCFSMLGLVVAGNIGMVFIFWELVGICSYFLIGFYFERKSASNAANKAFIVNRVGDFGMIVGLMAIWGSLGTFAFGDRQDAQGHVVRDERGEIAEPGLFSLVRPESHHHQIQVPLGMVKAAASDKVAAIIRDHASDLLAAQSEIDSEANYWRAGQNLGDGQPTGTKTALGYGLLVVAGLGIFCGCVGKGAQFPLHVWLPDAMEGPTPVSALVHSATMVAAGVYLVGRFYPVFTPEVLLVIAYIGAITLLLAATVAITATDIKRVLAYSTISQLGYMMLGLGVGGWVAGLFHLVTHAFFKSLLFLCSGSVIHACHTNDMSRMGGLRKKMPYTAYTMLVGCLAIIGTGIPLTSIGFSGFYSKDTILEQALSFGQRNHFNIILFYAAAGGAAMTAFYMFRLWFLTFANEPRDHHVHEHAHESPKVMYVPLVILAAFALAVGWSLPVSGFSVTSLLEQARPDGTLVTVNGGQYLTHLVIPNEHDSHAPEIKIPAGLWAFGTALAGFTLAVLFYGVRRLSAKEAKEQFSPVYWLLINKWWFDELYNAVFVQPTMFIARRVAEFDRRVIDRFIDNCALGVKRLAMLDDWFDRLFVDGLANLTARWTYSVGLSLRNVQTGRLRQYVMLIVVGTVALFILTSFFWSYSQAGS